MVFTRLKISMITVLISISMLAELNGTVWTVKNTNDAGPDSLRAAIMNALSFDFIRFDIGTGGSQTIYITSGDLPALADQVTIDGTTQPGFTGTPLIAIIGKNVNNGLTLGNFDIVDSVAIGSMQATGIVANGVSNLIQNCYIGTDQSGNVQFSNNDGIVAIGTNNTILSCIVSGNLRYGIRLESNSNIVKDSKIGITASGLPLGN